MVVKSEHKNPTLYFGNLSKYAPILKEKASSVVFVGSSFVFGLVTQEQHLPFG